MNKYFLVFLCSMFHVTSVIAQFNFTQYVNPFIGTGGHGHTFPGATMPFAMVQLSPDTRIDGSWDGCSGYHYSDSLIYGFSHTHLSGTGCSDYGDIAFLPTFVDKDIEPASKLKEKFGIPFSHKNEKAGAGWYYVKMDNGVKVKLTSTLRCGMQEYSFPRKGYAYIKLDLTHRDKLLQGTIVESDTKNLKNYIEYSGKRFSKAWANNQKLFYNFQINKIPITKQIITGEGGDEILLLKFEVDSKTPIIIKTGISGVDEDGAKNNLKKEMLEWDFEKYKKQANDEWNKELSKININNSGKIELKIDTVEYKYINQLTIFYTALYHCMIHPSIYNDADNRYRGRDDKIHNTEGKFDYYTVFSLWDTYRALHPLLTIIDKKRTNDFINTFIKQYEQCGRLPIWELWGNETDCMIGYHAVSVIWDAYNKGIRDYDVEKAFEAMKSIATHYTDYDSIRNSKSPNYYIANKDPTFTQGEEIELRLKPEARKRCADADALESYCKYGYVRADDSHESVSKTLEYAYDDWCIAQMANALNKKEDYEYYTNRSHNWMNVYDPTTGFMRARKNGCLYEPFSPYTVDNNYTEANSWQYSFYVPHDIHTLLFLHGSHDKYEKDIDNLFKAKEKTEGREQADITGLIGQYAHGNEPSHNLLYLYQYTINLNYKADSIKNYIIKDFYKNEPDGLIGNEDCGQMSAWYVLNTIGIYPFCPGDNNYLLSKPFFRSIKIKSGNDFNFSLVKTDTLDKNYLKNLLFDYIDWTSYEFKNYYYNKSRVSNIISHKIYPEVNHKDLQKISMINYNTTNIKNSPDYDEIELGDMEIINVIVNPFLINGKRIFKDSLFVEMSTGTKIGIFYSTDNKEYSLYKNPFIIKENTTVHFYSDNQIQDGQILFKNDRQQDKYFKKSPIQTATFTKLPNDRKIILKNDYNPSYHAGGAEGLMDGLYGKLNWRAGDWQGYQGQDIEVIMALDNPQKINTIASNFLEDQNSWIFYPKEISFYVSNDSITWTLVETIPTNKSNHNTETTISKFKTNSTFNIQNSKFIKLVAKNFGPMPEWHEGRGNPTFMFIDEFEVK